jgi:hypothetical protein
VACFTVALPLDRRWATQHVLAPTTPHDERDVTQKRGRFLDVAPPYIGEPSLWLERPEHPLSMAWL